MAAADNFTGSTYNPYKAVRRCATVRLVQASLAATFFGLLEFSFVFCICQDREITLNRIPREKSSDLQGISSFLLSIVSRSPPTGSSFYYNQQLLLK